jgi:hypothetical protein
MTRAVSITAVHVHQACLSAQRVLFGLGLTSAGYRRSFRTGRRNDEGYPGGYPRIAFLYLCNSHV